MRIVKVAVLGLALVGFTGGAALANCGWKHGKTAQTTKQTTKQTTVTNDTKK
jgi:hypothetical protein